MKAVYLPTTNFNSSNIYDNEIKDHYMNMTNKTENTNNNIDNINSNDNLELFKNSRIKIQKQEIDLRFLNEKIKQMEKELNLVKNIDNKEINLERKDKLNNSELNQNEVNSYLIL